MGAQSSGAQRARRPYTEEDDRFVAERYGDWSNRQIAEALGRTESGIRYRAKKLGLDRDLAPVPKVPNVEEDGGESRLTRLVRLRELMEDAIVSDEVPMMQRPAYYREYRALLKEIDELEGGSDGEPNEDSNKGSFAAAIERLAEQQRELLERAAKS